MDSVELIIEELAKGEPLPLDIYTLAMVPKFLIWSGYLTIFRGPNGCHLHARPPFALYCQK
ncbi:hypothetical protein KDK_54560 [Dictyobacter kobayashii]|uniref:Uncharacterized protein n=1 Tax=Dictyobacter kobayashii TaxID=2014872 RepID=A0A402ARC2_9CHLR|nr:hypothetical protein KDK_54560 [Dictyobacter kobayashii]